VKQTCDRFPVECSERRALGVPRPRHLAERDDVRLAPVTLTGHEQNAGDFHRHASTHWAPNLSSCLSCVRTVS
jgi:hypothetical protein